MQAALPVIFASDLWRRLINPLVKVNSLGIFPRRSLQGMQMAREDGGIDAIQKIRCVAGGVRRGRFCRGGFSFSGPLCFQPWPVYFLKVDIGKSADFFWELGPGRGDVCRRG